MTKLWRPSKSVGKHLIVLFAWSWHFDGMKNEILHIVSELICVRSLLGRNPPQIVAAQVHIDDAYALLLKLDEILEDASFKLKAV
jgi:hypothetical protein